MRGLNGSNYPSIVSAERAWVARHTGRGEQHFFVVDADGRDAIRDQVREYLLKEHRAYNVRLVITQSDVEASRYGVSRITALFSTPCYR